LQKDDSVSYEGRARISVRKEEVRAIPQRGPRGSSRREKVWKGGGGGVCRGGARLKLSLEYNSKRGAIFYGVGDGGRREGKVDARWGGGVVSPLAILITERKKRGEKGVFHSWHPANAEEDLVELTDLYHGESLAAQKKKEKEDQSYMEDSSLTLMALIINTIYQRNRFSLKGGGKGKGEILTNPLVGSASAAEPPHPPKSLSRKGRGEKGGKKEEKETHYRCKKWKNRLSASPTLKRGGPPHYRKKERSRNIRRKDRISPQGALCFEREEGYLLWDRQRAHGLR